MKACCELIFLRLLAWALSFCAPILMASLPPEILEARRRELGVTHRVPDVLVAKVSLQGAVSWHPTLATLSFGTRILVFKTDGYSPSIKLVVWSLSANSHFGP
jgi:hypothetical protein